MEAWQKRRYVAHFVSKLSDADGEQAETQHWVDTCFAWEYISDQVHGQLLEKCKEIGKMIGKMMKEPEKWYSRFPRLFSVIRHLSSVCVGLRQKINLHQKTNCVISTHLFPLFFREL